MRTFIFTLLVVLISVISMVGCAQKASVKFEEPVAPAVTVLPEPAQVIPAQEQPSPPPPSPEQRELATPEKGLFEELAKVIVPPESDKKVLLEAIHFDFDKSDLREPKLISDYPQSGSQSSVTGRKSRLIRAMTRMPGPKTGELSL